MPGAGADETPTTGRTYKFKLRRAMLKWRVTYEFTKGLFKRGEGRKQVNVETIQEVCKSMTNKLHGYFNDLENVGGDIIESDDVKHLYASYTEILKSNKNYSRSFASYFYETKEKQELFFHQTASIFDMIKADMNQLQKLMDVFGKINLGDELNKCLSYISRLIYRPYIAITTRDTFYDATGDLMPVNHDNRVYECSNEREFFIISLLF